MGNTECGIDLNDLFHEIGKAWSDDFLQSLPGQARHAGACKCQVAYMAAVASGSCFLKGEGIALYVWRAWLF